MSLQLILKDIDDEYVLENFRRIIQFFDEQTILNGNWKLFKIEIPGPIVDFNFKHNLDFIPTDILVLSVKGDKRVNFKHELFTRTHIVLDAEGAACVTILAGSYGVRCPADGFVQVPVFPPTLTAPIESQAVTYLASGDVNFIEFFNSATQVTANRTSRVDITYTSGDPTTELWKYYDTDGVTVIGTVTYTHTFVSGELTTSLRVSA